MSWIRCDDCHKPFNSDNDPDCFVEIGIEKLHDTIVLCELCRDARIERRHERQERNPGR